MNVSKKLPPLPTLEDMKAEVDRLLFLRWNDYQAIKQLEAEVERLKQRVYMPCHVCEAEPFTKHRSICSVAGWQEARVVAEQMKTEVERLKKELDRYRRNCTCKL